MAKTLPDMLKALKNVPEQPVRGVKLADVKTEWEGRGGERLVFVP